MIKRKIETNLVTKILIISILASQITHNFAATAMIGTMQAIKVDLGLSAVLMQWLIVAYSIIASSLILISGQLGDVFGHFKLFIIGVVLSLFGCILFCIGTSASIVMIATILRGLSTAIIVPGSMASLILIMDKNKMKNIVAIWATSILFGFGVGPIIGGLCSEVNWRIPYYFCTGFFLILSTILILFRKNFKNIKLEKKIDLVGSLLLFIGLITLVLLLSEGPYWGWSSAMNISLYAISPIAIILFFYSQTKTKDK